jgi:hypothetical protein
MIDDSSAVQKCTHLHFSAVLAAARIARCALSGFDHLTAGGAPVANDGISRLELLSKCRIVSMQEWT